MPAHEIMNFMRALMARIMGDPNFSEALESSVALIIEGEPSRIVMIDPGISTRGQRTPRAWEESATHATAVVKADCVLRAKEDIWHAIFSGTCNPQSACVRGELLVEGESSAALALYQILTPSALPMH